MPNLIPYIDTSEIYDIDISTKYDFIDCRINNQNYQLKFAAGIYNGKKSYYYLLTDNEDKHLAILRLVELIIDGQVYHQISKSYSLIQQHGYGEILYENCLKIHDTDIVSDKLNTLPGSFNLWRKIINKNNLVIFSFNILNKRKSRIKLPLNEFQIWGVENSFLEAIKVTPWEAVRFSDGSEDVEDVEDVSENENFIDYLTEEDIIQRTILSDFIVKALQSKRKILNREAILLLFKKQ